MGELFSNIGHSIPCAYYGVQDTLYLVHTFLLVSSVCWFSPILSRGVTENGTVTQRSEDPKKKNENRIGERTLTFCNYVAKYLINKGLVGWRKTSRLNGLNIGSLFFIPAFFYLG